MTFEEHTALANVVASLASAISLLEVSGNTDDSIPEYKQHLRQGLLMLLESTDPSVADSIENLKAQTSKLRSRTKQLAQSDASLLSGMEGLTTMRQQSQTKNIPVPEHGDDASGGPSFVGSVTSFACRAPVVGAA